MILFYSPESPSEDQSVMFGMRFVWVPITLLTLPFVLGLWTFWSGNWRRPIITAGIVYAAVFLITVFELVEIHTPPEKRMIHLTGIDGTDVYCNGVHLGQLPMKIRVDELIAKVPPWDTPPEQRWYDNSAPDQMLYTWLPWDDFIKERFIASKELSEAHQSRNISNVPRAVRAWRAAVNKHEADTRYWWSYTLGDVQLTVSRGENPYYLNRPFEKQSNYYPNSAGHPSSPSAGIHAQLLVDVLPELTPEQKADWDAYVLKHWRHIGGDLGGSLLRASRRRDENDPLYKLYDTALYSTARLQYSLSDPPAESEARRLLADWVADDPNPFRFQYDYTDRYTSSSMPFVSGNKLIPADIHEVMRVPLAEQWRKNKYRLEPGWAPVAYFSGMNKSSDYFSDLARFTATTNHIRMILLENESPLTVPLFRTLLYRRGLGNFMIRQIHFYSNQIKYYAQVNNPLVEAEMRDYIAHALSDPDHTEGTRRDVNTAVSGAVFNRINRNNIDKDDLAAWTASLPIPPSSKNLALRTLRIRRDSGLTFADRLQQASGRSVLIETELTLDDMTNWFAENPEGNLYQFIGEQEENITVSGVANNVDSRYFAVAQLADINFDSLFVDRQGRTEQTVWHGLPRMFVIALLRSDTPEGNPQVRELIRQIWTRDSLGKMVVASAIADVNISVSLRYSDFAYFMGTNNLPDYILDWLKEEMEDEMFSLDTLLAPILALCDSPKAEKILEQWLEKAAELSRSSITHCLEIWRTRHTLQQMKMEFFQDLLAGRMSPDDLFTTQPVWVWSEGTYVQR